MVQLGLTVWTKWNGLGVRPNHPTLPQKLLPNALPRFGKLRDQKLPVGLTRERWRIKADQLASPPNPVLLFGRVAEPILPNHRA